MRFMSISFLLCCCDHIQLVRVSSTLILIDFVLWKGSHHTREPWWHSHDNLMGDNKWAWLEHCGVRDFRGQPQLYCKRKAQSVYVLQLYLRIHSSLHNKKAGGNRLIEILIGCFLVFPLIWKPEYLSLLQFDTKYYYAVGIGQTVRKFWFMTPPKSGPDVPYTFGLIGIS